MKGFVPCCYVLENYKREPTRTPSISSYIPGIYIYGGHKTGVSNTFPDVSYDAKPTEQFIRRD